jgi:hypothetical protein
MSRRSFVQELKVFQILIRCPKLTGLYLDLAGKNVADVGCQRCSQARHPYDTQFAGCFVNLDGYFWLSEALWKLDDF